MAEVPDNGDLQEISEGNWIYWVEPQDAANFMTDNEEIFAELYSTTGARTIKRVPSGKVSIFATI